MDKARILIVEDESITALDLQRRLTGLGYGVVGRVATGEAAVRKASDLQPDLVLMDIHLKGEMDGIQAAALIRSQNAIPIIFVTAFADAETLERAKVTEVFGYILKPFEERELAVNIEIVLYKHKMEQKLRDSEARLHAIFDTVFDGIFLIDLHGGCVEVNPAGCAMTGYTRHELLSGNIRLPLLAEKESAIFELDSPFWQQGAQPREQRLTRKDGVEIWIEIALSPLKLSSQYFILSTVRDISARKQAEAALRESEERYMLAAQGANDGLWDWNLTDNRIYFSPRWKSILGYWENEIGEQPDDWFERVHPDDQVQLKMELSAHLKGQTWHFENEHRVLHKDGTYRWVLCRGLAIRDTDRIAYRISGSLSDITNRKRAEEQLVYDAFHDALTGLPNRALFLNHLALSVKRSRRQDDYAFGILFLDLDQFKIVNDSLGHATGDKLLIATGRLLESCVRAVDTVARLGGDEFVILLDNLESREGAIQVAERIQAALQSPFIIEGQFIYTSASMGIVFSKQSYERAEDILRDADIAMYQAKSQGKSRYAIFEPHMLKRAIVRLELENDLRKAIEREEFHLYYQPIYSLENDKIVGFEALIRWQHPKQGFLLPGDFIPLAEETGLILSVGRWVLRAACRQMNAWQERYPAFEKLFISVNVSGIQVIGSGFVQQVLDTIRETGLKANSLRIEITENILMENKVLCESVVKSLNAQGVQVFIDDFGTGYSSLSYIQHFPISAIKIDRSFTHQIDAGERNADLIQSILRFAQDLKLSAIAEGIETAQQLEQLKKLLCAYGQGFYISKPLDAQSAELLLARESIDNRS